MSGRHAWLNTPLKAPESLVGPYNFAGDSFCTLEDYQRESSLLTFLFSSRLILAGVSDWTERHCCVELKLQSHCSLNPDVKHSERRLHLQRNIRKPYQRSAQPQQGTHPTPKPMLAVWNTLARFSEKLLHKPWSPSLSPPSIAKDELLPVHCQLRLHKPGPRAFYRETASKQTDMLGKNISCEATSEGEQEVRKHQVQQAPEEVMKFEEGQFEL